MSDLRKYVRSRKARDPEFAEGFDAGYRDFKIEVIVRQAREEAGLPQEQLPRKLQPGGSLATVPISSACDEIGGDLGE